MGFKPVFYYMATIGNRLLAIDLRFFQFFFCIFIIVFISNSLIIKRSKKVRKVCTE